jgi:DNA-binding MarR family transcriptional regulator
VNGFELYMLGRKLMKLGEEALPPSGFRQMPASVRSVLVDIFEHPGSSVSEITARTGFPQSHVSASVTRLREAGGVVTASDPTDRRRTLVSPNPQIRHGHAALAWVPVDAVLAEAGSGDSGEVAEALAALEVLARFLSVDPLGQTAPAAGRA